MGQTANRITWNIAIRWLTTAASAGVSLLIVPFLIARLGLAGYGTAEFITTIVFFTILSDLGLRFALGRHLAEQVAIANLRRTNELFNSALLFYAVLAILVVLVCAFFAVPIVDFFGVPVSQRPAAIFLIRYYVAASVVISFVGPTYAAIIEAYHRFDITDGAQLGDVGVRAIGMLLVLGLTETGLYGWAGAMLAGRLAGLAICLWFAHDLCPELKLSPRFVRRDTFNELFSLSGLAFLYHSSLQLNLLTDPMIVARLLGTAAVGYYKPAALAVTAAYPFVSALSRQFKPLVAAYSGTGQWTLVQDVLVRGTRLTFLTAIPFCVILGVFAAPISDVWLGTGFDPTARVLFWLALLDLSKHLREAQGFIMVGLNRIRFVSLVQTVGAALTIGAGVVCVQLLQQRRWGLESMAGVVMPAVAIGWFQLLVISIYAARQLGVSRRRYFQHGFLGGFVVLGLSILVAIATKVLLQPASLPSLAAAATITGTAWLVLCWLIALDREDKVRLRAIARRVLRREAVSSASRR